MRDPRSVQDPDVDNQNSLDSGKLARNNYNTIITLKVNAIFHDDTFLLSFFKEASFFPPDYNARWLILFLRRCATIRQGISYNLIR